MEKELGGLPEGWELVLLDTISEDISYGYTASSVVEPIGPKMLRITDIQNNTVNWQLVPYCRIDEKKKSQYLMKAGDLVFARTGATVGKSYLIKNDVPDSVYASYLIRVRCNSNVVIEFLSHFFNAPTYWQQITDFSAGIGQPNVNGTKLKGLLIPLAGREEQKIIADKLDSLLAQVDSIKTRLDQIPQILKRFRQAVLSAAVSGKLSGNVIAEELFKPLGNTGLIIKTGPFGSALHKSDYVFGGISIINPMHINDGVITASESMTISDAKYSELESWGLKDGDVVVGRRGEMGRAAVVSTQGNKMLCGTGSMILRAPSNALPKYLEFILRSPLAINYFNSESVGSTMVNLNQKVITNLNVFFPSLEEQTEIVARVEKLFAWADNIEKQVNAAQQRVNNLTQSILAKAFRGELTEQWRKDHPQLISGENSAAALLEKIKAERLALAPKRKTKAKRQEA